MKTVKVTPPNIPSDAMERMWKFFLKTSIPRLVEKERMKNKEMEEIAQ